MAADNIEMKNRERSISARTLNDYTIFDFLDFNHSSRHLQLFFFHQGKFLWCRHDLDILEDTITDIVNFEISESLGTSIGFPDQVLNKLFEKFEKLFPQAGVECICTVLPPG